MLEIGEFLKIVEQVNRWDHNINYKDDPLVYAVTDDCGGMYICEPYKTEILKVWKFTSIEGAKKSSKDILEMFKLYVKNCDFIGADMARKYLQAGSKRSVIALDCRQYFSKAYNKALKNKQYFTLKEAFINLQKEFNEEVNEC